MNIPKTTLEPGASGRAASRVDRGAVLGRAERRARQPDRVPREVDGVLQEHRDRHRADAARDRGDVTHVFERLKVCIAYESFDTVSIDTNIDDGCFLSDHF